MDTHPQVSILCYISGLTMIRYRVTYTDSTRLSSFLLTNNIKCFYVTYSFIYLDDIDGRIGNDVNFLIIIHAQSSGVWSFMFARVYVGNPWQKFPLWKCWITSKFILHWKLLDIYCYIIGFKSFDAFLISCRYLIGTGELVGTYYHYFLRLNLLKG